MGEAKILLFAQLKIHEWPSIRQYVRKSIVNFCGVAA